MLLAQTDGPANPSAKTPSQSTAPARDKPANPDAADPDPDGLLLALLLQPPPVSPLLPRWQKTARPQSSLSAPQAADSKPAAPTPQRPDTEAKSAEPKGAPAPKTPALAAVKSSAAASQPAPVKPEPDAVTEKPAAAPNPKAMEKAAIAEAPATGTSGATGSQRMNLDAERNEIAGGTEQKLPLAAAITAVAAVEAGGEIGQRKAKSHLEFTWHDTPAQGVALIDPAVKTTQGARETEAASAPAGSPLDRIEAMISREVVTIREKGADSLGVSLKLDAGTQLFLQLTTHNGQLQATLRCERGDFSALDTQWTQLQQALARQNVQLLPPGSGVSTGFGQAADHRQRPFDPSDGEAPAANPAAAQTQTRKPRNQNRSRQRWESWA
jgi:hypothetical protein